MRKKLNMDERPKERCVLVSQFIQTFFFDFHPNVHFLNRLIFSSKLSFNKEIDGMPILHNQNTASFLFQPAHYWLQFGVSKLKKFEKKRAVKLKIDEQEVARSREGNGNVITF